MSKKYYQWVVLTLSLAASVGCTVPFLLDRPDNADPNTSQAVTQNPGDVANALPVFLPQPGATANPIPTPPDGGFVPIATPNPEIEGALPSATATPFLPNIGPNIDNQIFASPLPLIGIGRGTDGTGGGSVGSPIRQPIVPSIIKGRVLGFDIKTETYKPLANANVRIDQSLSLSTDENGFYETAQEFNDVTSISASFDNYVSSTVTDVPPGVSRDIHLNPLNSGPLYRQETFNFEGTVTNLNENGRDAFVVFADGNESFAPAASPDKFSGRYRMQVRVKASRTSTTGTLFTGAYEKLGSLWQLSQYGYSPEVVVPTPPPAPVATPTPEPADDDFVPLNATQLLLSFNHLLSPEAFGTIQLNLATEIDTTLRGVVVHVYMNLPSNGGRVLVAKYNDLTSTNINLPIRLPRIANTTFTVEARSGTSVRGSDIIVPNVQIGNTISRTFMEPPQFNRIGDETDFSDLNKTHFSTSDLTPDVSWDRHEDANSYQLDLQGETPDSFRWEAYTLGTSVTYPDFGTDDPASLKLGKSYRVHLMASDFDIGTFNVLSANQDWNMPDRIERALTMTQGNAPFKVQLFNPSVRNFSQGYRISYSTLTFLAN